MMRPTTPLPEPVPYLNTPEDYFLGNGVAAGGGAGDGTWNFLSGPDYTCPNYLKSEAIHVTVDGTEQSLTVAMHRGRKTGIFYGTQTIGDVEVCLVDYALNGEPWLGRWIKVKNVSRSAGHVVGFKALIQPVAGSGRSDWIGMDRDDRARGVSMKLDTSLKCAHNWACPNWANRYALIAFNDLSSVVRAFTNGEYVIETVPQLVGPAV